MEAVTKCPICGELTFSATIGSFDSDDELNNVRQECDCQLSAEQAVVVIYELAGFSD